MTAVLVFVAGQVALDLSPKQKERLVHEFVDYSACLRKSVEERGSIVNILQQVGPVTFASLGHDRALN